MATRDADLACRAATAATPRSAPATTCCAIAWAQGCGDELLEDAEAAATEFAEDRHLFQHEAIYAACSSTPWSHSQALQDWARAARTEIDRWDDLTSDAAARHRALDRMPTFLLNRRRHTPRRVTRTCSRRPTDRVTGSGCNYGRLAQR